MLPFYWIDAFTDRPFAGNPAGVMPLDTWPADELMQRMATQHGLAETAFFVRTGEARFHLRWFTPEREIDLCGHATLASAWALFHERQQPGDLVTFDTLSGPLVVRRATAGRLELDFPARPPIELAPAAWPADLVPGLAGAVPTWVGKARDYLCVFPDAAAVRALRPDFARLAQVEDTVGIIATAPGEAGDCDFVSRFFAPRYAVPEDPVTGSSHCTLVPYWAEHFKRTELFARQISPRGGELWCALDGARVRLAGRAATYLRGTITL